VNISRVLFAVSLFLAVVIAGRILGFAVTSVRTKGRIARILAGNGQNDKAVEACIEANRAAADKIKERNFFTEQKKKPEPPTCSAILGSKVLINGEWYEVGDEVEGAKILAVGPREVTILWEEKEKKLYPFETPSGRDSGRSAPRRATKSEDRSERRAGPAPPDEGRRDERRFGRGRFGRFFDMSEDERRELRDRVRDMSPDQRREFFRQRRREFESGQ